MQCFSSLHGQTPTDTLLMTNSEQIPNSSQSSSICSPLSTIMDSSSDVLTPIDSIFNTFGTIRLSEPSQVCRNRSVTPFPQSAFSALHLRTSSDALTHQPQSFTFPKQTHESLAHLAKRQFLTARDLMLAQLAQQGNQTQQEPLLSPISMQAAQSSTSSELTLPPFPG